MKKFIIIVITLLVLSNTYLLYNNYNLKKQVLSYEEKANIRRKNAISMMLETEANSKTYIQSTDNKWPTNGYVFNEQMSKCEQGSILKWDDANKKVIMEGNVSDKCYVFFDKYNPIKINSYTITPNGKKITISISATSGTGTITKYFYSKDDGASYVESTSNTYTFTNLAKGTYKIKAYVLDSNNKISEVISKNIEITSMSLSEYVMSQYTGTQGKNNIYYHDANLTNGAGDNSYRYAGANPNNFVCFGSDASPCPTDNLYRIIGVFGEGYHGVSEKQLVKLIKYDYMTTDELGTDGDYSQTYKEWGMDSTYKGTYGDGERIGVYFWNKDASTNTWSTSLLNKTNLNTNFINYLGTTWANKIATVTWKVGGNTWANIGTKTSSVAYTNEITNPVTTNTTDNATTYSAKIGLMYVSEYGFATEPSAWTTKLYSYDGSVNGSTIRSQNWMHMGYYDWTISRNSANSNNAFIVNSYGFVSYYYVGDGYGVRPSFNLLSSITYVSGSGSMSDPIRVN